MTSPLVVIPGITPGLAAARAFGAVSAPEGSARTNVDLVDLVHETRGVDARDAVDALVSAIILRMDRAGVDRADILAEGVSATASLVLAARHPERVSRLLLAAPVGFPGPVAAGLHSSAEYAEVTYAVHLGNSGASLAALRRLSRSDTFATTDLSDDFRSAAASERVRDAVESLCGWIADGAFDMVRRPGRDTLRGVKQPVALYWGREDAWSTIDSAFFVARRLSDARLRVLPGCGHLVGLQAAGIVARSVSGYSATPNGVTTTAAESVAANAV